MSEPNPPNEYRLQHLPPPPPPSQHWQPSSCRIPALKPEDGTRRSVRGIPLLLILILLVTCTWFVPPVVEQTAYSWNRGIECAKAEVAKQLLSEMPAGMQPVAWVAKAVAPCVVGIQTAAQVRGELTLDGGSGVVVDKEHILTNFHVINRAEAIRVRFNNGQETIAEVVGQDRLTDLAVLKVKADKLQPVVWGDSTEVEVGDQVIAIGSPYNLQATVTSGIISAVERYNPVPDRSRLQEYIQTDAAINPGNSGGALVNMKGELIGINTMIYSDNGGSVGIGFAIPSIMAKKVCGEIIQHGKMEHGWLGIYMEPVGRFDADKMHREDGVQKGAVVRSFLSNSPAEKAGIQIGDIILRWGDKEINDPLHLSHIIVLSKPGTTEKVEVFRGGKKLTCDVTLGKRPIGLR